MKIMYRKKYEAPAITEHKFCTKHFLMGSTLDSTSDSQNITPTDEEYDGEFTSRRRSQWEDDEEEDY